MLSATFMGVFAARKGTFKANEVKDEMMKFNLLIRRYIELYKWIKSRASRTLYEKNVFDFGTKFHYLEKAGVSKNFRDNS